MYMCMWSYVCYVRMWGGVCEGEWFVLHRMLKRSLYKDELEPNWPSPEKVSLPIFGDVMW